MTRKENDSPIQLAVRLAVLVVLSCLAFISATGAFKSITIGLVISVVLFVSVAWVPVYRFRKSHKLSQRMP